MDSSLIIIIDDDHRNIFALNLVLKSRGYGSISATSFAEGLKLIHKNPQIKMVLMDMMMPEIDGYQGISIIKNDENLNNLTIIALTAQAMMGDKERCIAAGANGYVSKPVDIDQLMIYVNKYLNNV